MLHSSKEVEKLHTVVLNTFTLHITTQFKVINNARHLFSQTFQRTFHCVLLIPFFRLFRMGLIETKQ